jgi:hypothetical protein
LASFRSHAFLIGRQGDVFVSIPPEPERIEERAHIPYSAINIIDDGGDGLRVWDVQVVMTAAEYTALKADRGQTGSLVTNDGTYSNSKLSQIRNAQASLDRDFYMANLEFILGAPV